jgi:hypothetical protein
MQGLYSTIQDDLEDRSLSAQIITNRVVLDGKFTGYDYELTRNPLILASITLDRTTQNRRDIGKARGTCICCHGHGDTS